jgi:hypothetical protein
MLSAYDLGIVDDFSEYLGHARNGRWSIAAPILARLRDDHGIEVHVRHGIFRVGADQDKTEGATDVSASAAPKSCEVAVATASPRLPFGGSDRGVTRA